MRSLFSYLFAMCISSLERRLLKSLARFVNGMFSRCWVLRVLCVFWMTVLYQRRLSHFLFVCALSSHDIDFHREEVFRVSEVQLSVLSWAVPWGWAWKVIATPWSPRLTPRPLPGVSCLHFTLDLQSILS